MKHSKVSFRSVSHNYFLMKSLQFHFSKLILLTSEREFRLELAFLISANEVHVFLFSLKTIRAELLLPNLIDVAVLLKGKSCPTVNDLCQPSVFTTMFPAKLFKVFFSLGQFIAVWPQAWQWSKPRANLHVSLACDHSLSLYLYNLFSGGGPLFFSFSSQRSKEAKNKKITPDLRLTQSNLFPHGELWGKRLVWPHLLS